jgi:4,5-DOPA dioxygenase extradiol
MGGHATTSRATAGAISAAAAGSLRTMVDDAAGSAPAAPPMPAAFLGHGNPMNALDTNRYTEAWRAFGRSVPRPRAILVVSAHWYINATAVTAMARPRTIHDFFGFPDELFAVDYPAPGAPDLAAEVADVVEPTWVGQDADSWGLDHGTWSVLVHAFPEADIPVVQLSINALQPFEYHLQLGARLAPLRDRGVLVVGSGNVVHNLRSIDWTRPDDGFAWAHAFDDDARDVMTSAPGELGRLQRHGAYAQAVPTPDHLIPLLYVAGLAAAAGRPAETLVAGYAMGSLSMTAYTLDRPATPSPTAAPEGAAEAGGPAPLPDVPPDETNI